MSHRRLPISPVERFDVVIDFVNLDGGDEVRVIARFGPYSGKYVFHCHNLEHEDMAMMANFEWSEMSVEVRSSLWPRDAVERLTPPHGQSTISTSSVVVSTSCVGSVRLTFDEVLARHQ